MVVMEPLITCRRASANDVGLFREIRLRALLESPDAFGSVHADAVNRNDASWREQLLSTVRGPLRNTRFAFRETECIGIAAVYREPDADFGELLMMWVAPDFRGGPAASLLVHGLLGWARSSGLSTVSLGVTDTNARAIGFYHKLGFSRTGETVEVDPERGLRGVRMVIRLDGC